MKTSNIKSKRKSLRRQWSVDVPSGIQKKFREVTGSRRSKSLEEDVYKQKLLHDAEYDGQSYMRDKGSFENFGHDDHSEFGPPHSPSCSSSSSPWCSFEDDNSDGSIRENETQSQSEINNIKIEIKSCENFEKVSMRTKDILSVNTCGILSTIDELVLRSPTKRASPAAAELNVNKNKTVINDVPRKFAKSEEASNDEKPEIGERYRRYAICEEMERYIIVDHKGLSLRKYRETLIRHQVLKELCLL